MIVINVKENTLTIMYETIECVGEFIPEKLGHLQVFIDHNRIKLSEEINQDD